MITIVFCKAALSLNQICLIIDRFCDINTVIELNLNRLELNNDNIVVLELLCGRICEYLKKVASIIVLFFCLML